MSELKYAVKSMFGFAEAEDTSRILNGKERDVTSTDTTSQDSVCWLSVQFDVEFRCDEEPNQKHFQLTAFTGQSMCHLLSEGRFVAAVHPQKTSTCET